MEHFESNYLLVVLVKLIGFVIRTKELLFEFSALIWQKLWALFELLVFGHWNLVGFYCRLKGNPLPPYF